MMETSAPQTSDGAAARRFGCTAAMAGAPEHPSCTRKDLTVEPG